MDKLKKLKLKIFERRFYLYNQLNKFKPNTTGYYNAFYELAVEVPHMEFCKLIKECHLEQEYKDWVERKKDKE